MADLQALMRTHLATARDEERGRSVELIAHDGELRQSIVALADGVRLPPHNAPPAATVQVLRGRIRIDLDEGSQGELGEGELEVLTHERHSVLALADSVFLLTTVTSVGRDSHG